jgi:hypothetical protein
MRDQQLISKKQLPTRKKTMTYKTNNYYWDSVANRKPVAPETPAQRADRKQREAVALAAYVAKYGHSPFKRTK